MKDAELAVFGGVGAFRQIVGADADVAPVELRALEVHAQDLIARQGVVDATGVEVVVGRAAQRNVAGDLAERRGRVGHGRGVAVLAVEVEAERRALVDERAVQADPVLPALSRAGLIHQRVAAVHRAVVKAGPHRSPDRPDAGLGQDLDPHLAGEVHLRRELIAGHADRFDQRLRRQVAALEAVDEELRARPGDVHQLPPELVGIVRERLDLLTRHDRAEGHITVGRRLLAIALDRHRRLQAIDRQHHHLLVLAAPDADLGQRSRLKARELGRDRVAARDKALELHLPLRGRRRRRDDRRLVGRLDAGEGHRRARQHAARFVEHRHLQDAVPGGLREEGGRCEAGQAEERDKSAHHRLLLSHDFRLCRLQTSDWESAYFSGSSFLGSILALTRKRSKVVSSVVSVPMARRSRNGNFTPSTSR